MKLLYFHFSLISFYFSHWQMKENNYLPTCTWWNQKLKPFRAKTIINVLGTPSYSLFLPSMFQGKVQLVSSGEGMPITDFLQFGCIIELLYLTGELPGYSCNYFLILKYSNSKFISLSSYLHSFIDFNLISQYSLKGNFYITLQYIHLR